MIGVDKGKYRTSDTSAPSLFDQFYGIEITEDDLLEMSLLLESVHENLGSWFLDHDEEFQRDMMAGAKLFWQRRPVCRCTPKRETTGRHDKKEAELQVPEPEVTTSKKTHDPIVPKLVPQLPAKRAPRLNHTNTPKGQGPLVQLRLERGFDQKGLATMLGLSQGQICRLETVPIKPDTLRRKTRETLESFFHLPVEKLLLADPIDKGEK